MKNIVFDFDKMSLNEFKLGKVLKEDKGKEISIAEKELGYSVTVRQGKVSHISVYLTDSYGFYKYEGQIYKNDVLLDLNENSSFDYVENIFGDAYEIWDDGVEKNLRFSWGKYTIEFSWDIDCSAPKLMYLCVELQ